MDIQGILLVVFFALSTTAIPIYVYFTQKHFIRTRLVNAFQLLFWLYLASSSLRSILISVNALSEVLNFLLIAAGLLFSAMFSVKIYKDQGQYFMPFAKLANLDSFKAFGETIGEGKIKIYANVKNTVETIFFTDSLTKEQLMEEIASNSDLIMQKGTKEALTKLVTNFIFVSVIAIIVLI